MEGPLPSTNRLPIAPPDHIGHGFGFPICVHTFSSCVFIWFKNPVPTEKSLLFVSQKLLKRPYRCVVFFTRLSFYIYILNPTLIRRELNRMTCGQNRTRTCGLSAASHRTKYQLFHLTSRKTDGHVLHRQLLSLSLSIFLVL